MKLLNILMLGLRRLISIVDTCTEGFGHQNFKKVKKSKLTGQIFFLDFLKRRNQNFKCNALVTNQLRNYIT